MSIFGEGAKVIKEAVKLSLDVERMSKTVGELGNEMLLHDRRITTLEAKWDTAMQFAKRRGPSRIEG